MNVQNIQKITISFGLLAFISFVSTPLLAQEYKGGLWMRTLFGLGVSGNVDSKLMTERPAATSKTKKKYKVVLPRNWRATLSIGGVVASQLAVHGGLDWQSLYQLEDDKNKTLKGKASSTFRSYATLTAGITYYIASAANLYISPELRTLLFSDRDRTDGTSNYQEKSTNKADGIGYGLTIGKEWVISDSKTLGIALSYTSDSHKLDSEYIGMAISGGAESRSKTEVTDKINLIHLNFSSTFN